MRRWEAVILAAGASRRMGFPKALLSWGGEPLLVSLVRELLATRVARIVVVLGASADRVRREFEAAGLVSGRAGERAAPWPAPRLDLLVNPHWAAGKTTSIQAGVQALSHGATDLLLLNVDQPLRAEVMEAVMGAHEALCMDATLPAYQGRRGHPVALSLRWRRELLHLSEEHLGLRELIDRLESSGSLAVYDLAAPCIHWNLNRPEDVMLIGSGLMAPSSP